MERVADKDQEVVGHRDRNMTARKFSIFHAEHH
jgi:hypothetical protein